MQSLPTLDTPNAINQCLECCGLRYTFWRLTECDNCSISRAIYLILLSI